MNAIILASTTDMSREEWLTWRNKGLGGSDAAAVSGLSPWKSPIKVWMEKTGRSESAPDSEMFRQGRDFEDYVGKRFEEASGMKVRRRNAILQHPEYEWMLANIDRWIVGTNEGLEIKTTSAFNASEWEGGKVPIQYEIQCHHYMAVTGADAWWIACLIFNKAFVYKRIPRDEALIANLISIEKSFWELNILPDVMPAPDGSSDAQEAIGTMYPGENVSPGSFVVLGGSEWEASVRRYYILDELMDRLEREQDAIKQAIMLEMKDAEKCFLPGNTSPVTWKSVSSERVDTKALRKDLPDVAAKYAKTTVSRRFMVPAKAEEETA
jgi:putative phage-type endonuclease